MLQGYQLAVHLGPDTTMSDVGMNAIGKIDRGGTFGKGFHVSFRGKNIDLLGKEFHLDGVHEFPGILQLLLPFEELPEPGKTLHILFVVSLPLLVLPVGCDARFGNTMHLRRPDLYFHPLTKGSDDRRVQGLVHVPLGHGDIVLEASGNRLPRGMDNAEHFIALPDVLHEDPDGDQIIDLVDIHITALHLAIDGVEVLAASGHLSLDTVFDQLLGDDLGNFGHICFPLLFLLGHF